MVNTTNRQWTYYYYLLLTIINVLLPLLPVHSASSIKEGAFQ